MRIVKVVVLNPDDFERMKGGQTLELTPDIIVSVEGFKKPRVHVEQSAALPDQSETREERRRRQKREYMRKWHARHPNYDKERKAKQRPQDQRTVHGSYPCPSPGCGQVFPTKNARSGHMSIHYRQKG